MSAKLVLIRGLPGSGKTTLAKSMMDNNSVHCEADDFFMKDGKYSFDPSGLGEAHSACFVKARNAMLAGKTAIVSNTFTTLAEMEPYISFAKSKGIEVEVLEATGNYQSVHDVPPHSIDRMRKRWQKI